MSADKIVADLKRWAESLDDPQPVQEDQAKLAAFVAQAVGRYLLDQTHGAGYKTTDFTQINGGILWGIYLAYHTMLADNPAANQAAALNDFSAQTSRMVAQLWQDLRQP